MIIVVNGGHAEHCVCTVC